MPDSFTFSEVLIERTFFAFSSFLFLPEGRQGSSMFSLKLLMEQAYCICYQWHPIRMRVDLELTASSVVVMQEATYYERRWWFVIVFFFLYCFTLLCTLFFLFPEKAYGHWEAQHTNDKNNHQIPWYSRKIWGQIKIKKLKK